MAGTNPRNDPFYAGDLNDYDSYVSTPEKYWGFAFPKFENIVNLNNVTTEFLFTAEEDQEIGIATSGVTGGATIKVQHRVVETDDWVDNPNMVFTADVHLSGTIVVVAPFNRVVIEGATISTDINLAI